MSPLHLQAAQEQEKEKRLNVGGVLSFFFIFFLFSFLQFLLILFIIIIIIIFFSSFYLNIK